MMSLTACLRRHFSNYVHSGAIFFLARAEIKLQAAKAATSASAVAPKRILVVFEYVVIQKDSLTTCVHNF